MDFLNNLYTGGGQCCSVCLELSDGAQPPMRCESLNNCNGKGECVFGACQCANGWAGESCETGTSNDDDKPWCAHTYRTWVTG